MYTFSVTSQEEYFIFSLWTSGLVEMGDVLGKALPLGVVLGICSVAVICFGNQAKVCG